MKNTILAACFLLSSNLSFAGLVQSANLFEGAQAKNNITIGYPSGTKNIAACIAATLAIKREFGQPGMPISYVTAPAAALVEMKRAGKVDFLCGV